jgi:glycosyltransferase involved in cell wall biosynthesis
MNVFFLTQWYPSPESLIEGIFVREHARAIANYHRVFVVYIKGLHAGDTLSPKIKREKDGPLAVHIVGYPRPKIPKTAWLQRVIGVFKVFTELASGENAPDIIHANVYNTADLAMLLGKRYRLPAVLTEHASSYPRRLLNRFQAYRIRFLINQLQLVMPVSRDLCNYMRSYGIHGPYHPIPNTVDTNIFYPEPVQPPAEDGVRRILTVAQLAKVKGIDQLLQTLALVKSSGRRFRLLIAGDGPERVELERMAVQLNISGETVFLGRQTKQEIANLMRRADVLALTSRWDNQPVVTLEAMACGLPVFATKIGGIPEVVLPMCGRLAEPGNIVSMKEQLEYLLDHLDEYPRKAIAGYAKDHFSYSAVGRAYSEAYETVMKDFHL